MGRSNFTQDEKSLMIKKFPRIQALPYIAYYLLGLFHIVTMLAGFDVWFDGRYWFLKSILTGTLAYIPVVGNGVAMFAAVSAWGWGWGQAALVYLCPALVILVCILNQNEIEYGWSFRKSVNDRAERALFK